jgi:hypothetical protein
VARAGALNGVAVSIAAKRPCNRFWIKVQTAPPVRAPIWSIISIPIFQMAVILTAGLHRQKAGSATARNGRGIQKIIA